MTQKSEQRRQQRIGREILTNEVVSVLWKETDLRAIVGGWEGQGASRLECQADAGSSVLHLTWRLSTKEGGLCCLGPTADPAK